MKVRDICTEGTVHVPQTCTLQDAAIQMHRQHVGALVVTESVGQDRLIGLVTDRDIAIKAVAAGLPPSTVVARVMSNGAVTIAASADLSEAMQAMSSHGVRRLAVVDDRNAVVGIVSLDDIIEALGRDWVLLASILRSAQQRERTGSVQSPLHL